MDDDQHDRPDRHDRHDRGQAALLGTALGDAVGAPFEGRWRVARDDVVAWLADDATLVWTDDTHMAVELAAALAASGGRIDPQSLGDRFAHAYRDEPWRGYGAGPPQVFALAEHGVPYVEAAASMFGGSGSFGNGGAMRAAPAGVAASPSLERTAELAAAQARVTHAHPEGIDGAVAIATAVAALVAAPAGSAPGETLRPILDHVTTAALRDPLQRVLDASGAPARLEVASEVGSGIAARESVPAAVAAFLAAAEVAPGSGEEVLVTAVCLGGDTDTVGAMAGALAGAHLGHAGFPPRLADRLEDGARLEQVADELVRATA